MRVGISFCNLEVSGPVIRRPSLLAHHHDHAGFKAIHSLHNVPAYLSVAHNLGRLYWDSRTRNLYCLRTSLRTVDGAGFTQKFA